MLPKKFNVEKFLQMNSSDVSVLHYVGEKPWHPFTHSPRMREELWWRELAEGRLMLAGDYMDASASRLLANWVIETFTLRAVLHKDARTYDVGMQNSVHGRTVLGGDVGSLRAPSCEVPSGESRNLLQQAIALLDACTVVHGGSIQGIIAVALAVPQQAAVDEAWRKYRDVITTRGMTPPLDVHVRPFSDIRTPAAVRHRSNSVRIQKCATCVTSPHPLESHE